MNTTLNEIKKHHPCSEGWEKLLSSLGKTKADDEPLPFKHILDSNGIEDALWALCVLPFKDQALFRADIAESVLHNFETKYPSDTRPRQAIEALRLFARGAIGKKDLNKAARNAFAAVDVARNDYFSGGRDDDTYDAYDAAWIAIFACSDDHDDIDLQFLRAINEMEQI